MIPESLGVPCIYGDVGKAEFRNLRDLTLEFLGIPCIYWDVGKAEYRNRRDLNPGAKLIPECATLRNRMCSLPMQLVSVNNQIYSQIPTGYKIAEQKKSTILMTRHFFFISSFLSIYILWPCDYIQHDEAQNIYSIHRNEAQNVYSIHRDEAQMYILFTVTRHKMY